MFLDAVDTVLAFCMIMLLLSLLVTVLVQMVISIFGLRGKNLVFGVQQLVGMVAPDLDESDAASLATKVLNHPALGAGGKRASVELHPKEVLMVLDDLRKTEKLAPNVKAAIDSLFESDASEDSKLVGSLDILQKLRNALPEQAAAAQKLAKTVLAEQKEIVVRLDNWFDSAMNHASERLKLHARWITAGAALVFATGLEINAVSILEQLSNDPQVRAQVLAQTDATLALYDQAQAAAASPEAAQAKEAVDSLRATLAKSGLAVFGLLDEGWECYTGRAFAGSLLTALLLSLGAPFWYGVIGKIVGFRSALAGKQNTQATPKGG